MTTHGWTNLNVEDCHMTTFECM